MKLSHREKLRMARRMMSGVEIKSHTSPFLSKAWEERKKAIADRVVKRYSDFSESKYQLQQKIMLFIGDWVKSQKTPVPLGQILKGMVEEGIKEPAVMWAINALLRKQYIRRAIVPKTVHEKTFFVMLRSL